MNGTMTTHIYGEPLPMAMKLLNFMLPAISGLLTSVGLGIDWHYTALACGSAMAGSLLFNYFRREKTFGAQAYKMAMAAVGGLILGSYVVHWRGYTAPAEVSAVYCLSAMVVLIFLRTVVSLFEEHSRKITITLVQRIFNIKLDEKTKRPRRRGVHVSTAPNCPPEVVIEPTAEPDEIRVVEQTVVEQKPAREA